MKCDGRYARGAWGEIRRHLLSRSLQSFEPGQPGLLTECYDNMGHKNGYYGPMNPTKKRVYAFLEEFFEEISQVFPEKYLHLGGDEVDMKCW